MTEELSEEMRELLWEYVTNYEDIKCMCHTYSNAEGEAEDLICMLKDKKRIEQSLGLNQISVRKP